MKIIPSLHGGRWLRPLSLMLAAQMFAAAGALAQTTVTSRPAISTDDMEEVIATGALDTESSDIEMTTEGAGIQIIGLRFPALDIPRGASITSATIQFTADETNTETTTLTLRGEAADSSATFPLTSYGVSSRPQTAAGATWSVNAWNTIQERGANQRTSDIRNIIQEIVNRSGWKANNALSIFITGTGKRVAESFEGATSGAAGHDITQSATISITYVIPTTISVRVNASSDDAEENVTTGAIDMTSSDLELTEDGTPVFAQQIGMRFTGVNLPKSAIVTEAYIQFATDELFSNPTSLTIRGQAADNPTTFTTATNNISSRTVTAASASWAPQPWTVLQEAGALQRTPDLSAIVQEIISRPGWIPSNAMVIRITGTGHRTAEAFDGSAPEAPQLVVRYYNTAPVPAPIGVFPVPRTAVWQYYDNAASPGATWMNPGYNDSAWAYGPAQLGFGDGDEATVIGFGGDPNNKNITTYFRHSFDVASVAGIDSLELTLVRDDGAVVYLNGVEIVRSNMPAGSIGSATLASSNVAGSDESTALTFRVSKNALVAGRNVLAVEIHQDAPTSSDLSFSLQVAPRRFDRVLVASPSNWEFLDGGQSPAALWYQQTFNDTRWKVGSSPLGYGNDGEATKISFGADPKNKALGYYFRRSFTVDDTVAFGSLELRLRRDDGAIIYLNGAELLRSNMPSGAVTVQTPAVTFVEGTAESEYLVYRIDKRLLKMGGNTIAAEVHQNSRTSTDLFFDLTLTLREATATLSPLGAGTITLCDPASSDAIGCFTSVVPGPQAQTFVLPQATHTFQLLVKSGRDRYTGTNVLLPINNDFTGYVPLNGSSTLGHLSINQENNPGGVSMLDLHYNGAGRLWAVDTITRIDYTPVVKSDRNCSGTVTPWGTIISSEESYTTGDVNADGYHDVGWNTEIDPLTNTIIDHDGDGKPDKLWAVGRMSHENVVVSSDRRTLYQGEDGGTGAVYKFIADVPGRLDAGTLYALRRDSATATTGTWVRIPNTTQAERNTTSTMAGALGATRWGGVEDCEISPVNGMVYFTEKGRGDIWRFRDNGTTVSGLEAWVSNRPYPIASEAGIINESFGTGIDNLAFDNDGNLFALQDGGRNHIWVIRPDHTVATPHVELFATTPAGSEPTGITFSPDYRFMFLSFQHPNANTAVQKDAADSSIVWNTSATVVVARRQNLGAGAIAPVVDLGPDMVRCVESGPVELKYLDRDALGVWSDGSTDSVLRVSSSGDYILTATGNNGLVARDTVHVEIVAATAVDLGADQILCPGQSYTFRLPEGMTYLWDDGSSQSNRTVDRAGTYSVKVINSFACLSYDTVRISYATAAEPRLGHDLVLCDGKSATLNPGTGFGSYLWNTGATTPTLTVAAPGRYAVRVSNAAGCFGFDTVVVRGVSSPELGSDIELCQGSEATISPGGDYASYLWSNGTTGSSLNVATSGRYWVRVTGEGGCTGYDTLQVTVHAPAVVDLGRDTVICPACSIELDAGAGFASYLWSTGATSRRITVSQEGRYTVSVIDANGCSASSSIDVAVDAVSGVRELASNKRYSLRAWPNPFTSGVTVGITLKKRASVRAEVYDPAGRKVATLVDGPLDAGAHDLRFDAERFGGNEGVYLLRITVDGVTSDHTLVRK